ncbi:MAG: hypothetical protein K6G63_08410 [Eubacterium sp.]|nr:hypothetical protein [Eubacterium sp.]
MKNKDYIVRSILRDMSEGVMVIGLDGVIEYANESLGNILERAVIDLIDNKFAACFFEYSENDRFNQMILDAVYDKNKLHEGIVEYYDGEKFKTLHVRNSFLEDDGKRVALISVISDISELAELRDAVKAMEQIRALNSQLEMRNTLLNETFGRFLSDDIVRELLETPDGLALGGKKREVAIMMSDVRGFTAMSERMAPDDLLNMLNHYLGEMTEVIQDNNGTIIEFIGDGIMAIFGAPAENKYYARDAVIAAVKMQDKMKEINVWNEERGYPHLEMGIGLNSDSVIVGNIGSEKRTKYGVTGLGVNLAGRIESYTVGGQILIDPDTKRLAELELTVEDEFEIAPKGVNEPITISNISGIGEPYNISLASKRAKLTYLENKTTVPYRRLHEKHVGMHEHTAVMLAISEEEAIINVDADLRLYDNIVLDIGDKLYAKVVSVKDAEIRIRFTAVPECFGEYYEKIK